MWQLQARTDGLNSHNNDIRLRCPSPSSHPALWGLWVLSKEGPIKQGSQCSAWPHASLPRAPFLVRPSQDLQAGPPGRESQRAEVHWLYKSHVLGRSIVSLVWQVHIGLGFFLQGTQKETTMLAWSLRHQELKQEMAEEGFSLGQLPPGVASLCILNLKSKYAVMAR